MIDSSHPTISVVICTHNRCKLLKDTLVSLAQMAKPEGLPWELLVVDNNSSDQTKEVVESFSGGCELKPQYVFERAPGLSHARNRGVKESRADIISFLDDDVIVASDWLAQ